MAERILLIDDEPDLLAGLEDALVHEKFEVFTANNGKEGLKKIIELKPDFVILDLSMPQMTGHEVLAAMKKKGVRVPVIMLTASDVENDKIRGLETGADDYVTKPFSTRELLARIRAVQRRRPSQKRISTISFGDVSIDFDHQQVTKAGKACELSTCENDLLRLLVTRAGESISRETILTEVWKYESAPDTRTIDNHIVRLRQKIEDNPREPRHILTAHGTGYKFVR